MSDVFFVLINGALCERLLAANPRGQYPSVENTFWLFCDDYPVLIQTKKDTLTNLPARDPLRNSTFLTAFNSDR
jgi:hypothetical protein